MSMESDKLANKTNGVIGVLYHILSNLVNELREESIIMLQVNESDFSILQNRAIMQSIKERESVGELDKNYDPKKYLHILNKIAKRYSMGKKFSRKYENYSKFLEIDIDDNGVLGKLDSLFSLRNDLAHLNRFSDDEINSGTRPSIITEDGFKYYRETTLLRKDFEGVVKELLKMTSEVSKFLKEVEQESNSKWSPSIESSESHYA